MFSFLNDKSIIDNMATLGVPNYFSNFKLSDGSITNVQILDTAGSEKYRSLASSYYRKADCCLLVYDITERNSFDEIKDYFNEQVQEQCKKKIPVILLGNKTDLEENRAIPSEEAAKFCLENDYIFMETTCLKNTNVSDAFETLIELTNIEAKKNKDKDKEKGVKIKKDINIEKKKCHC